MTGQPRRKFAIGLKPLLLGAGGGILLLSAVIAAHFLDQAYKVQQEAEFEAAELIRYEATLKAIAAISDERRPSNNAMTNGSPAVTEELQKRRADTDARLSELLDAFQPELARGGVYFNDFALLKAYVRRSRIVVDKVAALPPEWRKSAQVAAATYVLFDNADAALALRDKLGSRIAARTHNLSAEIMLLNEAGMIREMSGRLGWYVVLQLAGSKLGVQERAVMDAIRAKLTLLWNDLRHYAPAHLKTQEVRAAVDATNRAYFLGSLPYLDEILDNLERGRSVSAKIFADRYLRGLDAANRLRAEIIRETVDAAKARAGTARSWLFVVVVSFGMLCSLLLGFAIVAGRLLFAPLLSARDEILALAADNLDVHQRAAGASRELEEIFDGITVLRGQLLEKREMEREQRRLTETLRFLSERDPLTQLLNRRAVEELAAARMRDGEAKAYSLGVLLLDLDHFKRINDTYGHVAGDLVLKAAAEEMQRILGAGDVAARFGGEEFLIILDQSDGDRAMETAERLRHGIAMMQIDHEPPIPVTASIGVCIRPPGTALAWSDIVAIADRRLYRAKAEGRNRICAKDGDDAKTQPVERTEGEARICAPSLRLV